MEPVDWECRGGFLAKTESGKSIEVNLEDGEFYDYDDDANESISLTAIRQQSKYKLYNLKIVI